MKILSYSFLFCALLFSQHCSADIVESGPGIDPIIDNDPAGSTSSINIGVDQEVVDVEVTINNFTHDWVGDLVVTITSPSGTEANLIVRTGGGLGDSSDVNGTYTFTDAAIGGANWWDVADGLGSGEVIPPGSYAATDEFGNEISLADAFAGESTLGNWTIFASDNASDSVGGFESWQLRIVTAVPEPSSLAVLATMSLAGLLRRRK